MFSAQLISDPLEISASFWVLASECQPRGSSLTKLGTGCPRVHGNIPAGVPSCASCSFLDIAVRMTYALIIK